MPKPNKCDNSRTLSNSTSDDSDDEYLSALSEAVDPTLHSTLYNQSESQTVKFQGNILFYIFVTQYFENKRGHFNIGN